MAHRLPPAGSLPPPPSDFFAFYLVHPPEDEDKMPGMKRHNMDQGTSGQLSSRYVAKRNNPQDCCCCCKQTTHRHHRAQVQPERAGPCRVHHKHYKCGLCVHPNDSESNRATAGQQCHCHQRKTRTSPQDRCAGERRHGPKIVSRRKETVTVTKESSVASFSGCYH